MVDMLSRRIELSALTSRELSGDRGQIMDRLRSKFPLLKITLRGDVISLAGEEKQMIRFERMFSELEAYYDRYGHISPDVIDQVFDTVEPSAIVRGSSKEKDGDEESVPSKDERDVIVYGNLGNVVRARTSGQRKLVKAYENSDLIFVTGPAGSGKTYTAIALAVRALKNKEVKRIVLTRPAVEAGEKLGFLPGDMKEKLDPYLQPLYDALHDMIPQKKLTQLMEEGVIQIAPLAFMRGRTLDNAFVILDEAQNTTLSQLKMFLTRMGSSAKFIVTGDASQIDLPVKSESGLLKAIDILGGIKGITHIAMSGKDIVRHNLVKSIVAAFGGMDEENNDSEKKKTQK